MDGRGRLSNDLHSSAQCVFAGVVCRYQRVAADVVLTSCQTVVTGCHTARRHSQFSSCHSCWHQHCYCVNGFPDSPVCISVSQLRCGDFLTLIAPLCCVHISWHKGCWVNMWSNVVASRALRDRLKIMWGLELEKQNKDYQLQPGWYWIFEANTDIDFWLSKHLCFL